VEWLFVVLLALIIVGPIVWAVSRGRGSGAPADEDAQGVTGWATFIRDTLTRGRGG
jgi:hypothetical protein